MKGVEIKVSSNSAQAKRDLAQLNKSVGSIDKTVSNLNKAFVALGVGIAGAFAVSKLNSTIAKASDSLTLMGNSIAQVTGRTKELSRVQSQLYDISRRTATSVETNTKVFKSFGIPLLETGRSIDEVVKAIDSLAVAGALGGESAESLNAALIQLGQGISSGALRGEELNSVLEQAPRIAKAISDELGVTRGSLRAIAKEGGLTAEVVVDALLNQSEKLNREFASMEFTSTEAMSNVKVTATRIIGEIDKELNFTSSKTNKLMGFANYLEANRESIVSKTVSQLSNLSVSMSGLTTTFSGLGAVIGVIVGRIGDSLPAAITPFLAISDDIVTVFSGTWFRIQAYWRKGIVDFNAMIAKTFGVGMQGAIRAIFTSNSLQEFGDSLHALSEALDSYGRRWYNIGNRTEKYFKSFTFRSRMFLIYLGLMEQKALFLQYVSFERLSKGLEVASYFAKKFVENIKATDSLAVLKTGLVQIVLLLKRVAEAFDNLAGNRLSKGIRYIGNSFKQVYSLSETWLKKATNVVKSFSETVERAFFWVYDQVIGNSWWTDTVEQTYYLSEKWLGRADSIVSDFGKKVVKVFKGVYSYVKPTIDSIFSSFKGLDFSALEDLKKTPVVAMKDGMYSAIGFVLERLSSVGSTLIGSLKEASPTMSAILGGVVLVAFSGIFGAGGSIYAIIKAGAAGAILAGFGSGIGTNLLNSGLFSDMGRALGSAIGEALNLIIDNIPRIAAAVLQMFVGIGKGILDSFGFIGDVIQIATAGLGNLIVGAIVGAGVLSLISSRFRGGLASLFGFFTKHVADKTALELKSQETIMLSAYKNQQRMIAIRKKAGMASAMGPFLPEKLSKEDLTAQVRSSGKTGLFDKMMYGAGKTSKMAMAGYATAAISAVAVVSNIFNGSIDSNTLVSGGLMAFMVFGPEGTLKGAQVLVSALEKVGDSITKVVTTGGLSLKDSQKAFTALGTTVASVGTTATSALTKLGSASKDVFSGLLTSQFGRLTIAVSAITILFSALSPAFADTGDSAGAAAVGVAALGGALLAMITFPKTSIKVLKSLTGIMGGLFSSIGNSVDFGKIASSLSAPFAQASTSLKSSMVGLFSSISASAAQTGAKIASSLTAPFSKFFASSQALFSSISEPLLKSFKALSSKVSLLLAAIPVKFGIAGQLSGTAFAVAFAAAIPIAIGLAALAIGAVLLDFFFNDSKMMKRLGEWLNLMFTKIKEFFGFGKSVIEVRTDLGDNLAKIKKNLEKTTMSVKIDANLINRDFSGLSASQRGNLTRSSDRLRKLSYKALQEQNMHGVVSNKTQESIKSELEKQSEILKDAFANPDKIFDMDNLNNKSIMSYFDSQRGFLDKFVEWFVGEKVKDGKSFPEFENFVNNMEYAKTRLEKGDTEGIGIAATAMANAIEFRLKTMDDQGTNSLLRKYLERQAELLGAIAKKGYANGLDVEALQILGIKTQDATKPDDEFFGGRVLGFIKQFKADLPIPSAAVAETAFLNAQTENVRTEFIQELNLLTKRLNDFGLDLKTSDVATMPFLTSKNRFKNKFTEIETLRKEVGLIIGTIQAETEEDRAASREGQKKGAAHLADLLKRISEGTEAIKMMAEAGMATKLVLEGINGSGTELAKSLKEFGVDANFGANAMPSYTDQEFNGLGMELPPAVAQSLQITNDSVRTSLEANAIKISDLVEDMNRLKGLGETLKSSSQLQTIEKSIERITKEMVVGVTHFENMNNSIENFNTDKIGLASSYLGEFAKYDIDMDKLLSLNPETILQIARAAQLISLLRLELTQLQNNGGSDSAIAQTSVLLKSAMDEMGEVAKNVRSRVEKKGSGGDSKTILEALTGRLSDTGFAMDIRDVGMLSGSVLKDLSGQLVAYEKLQKKFNKTALSEVNIRKQVRAEIEAIQDTIANTLVNGTGASVAAALEGVGSDIDLNEFLSLNPQRAEEYFDVLLKIKDLDEQIAVASGSRLRGLNSERNELVSYLDETMNKTKELSESFTSSISSNIEEVVKGAKSLKEGVMGVLEELSSAIISTVVDSFVTAFMESSGLEDTMAGVFAGLLGSSRKTGEQIGANIKAGMGSAMGGEEEGGFLSKAFGLLSGRSKNRTPKEGSAALGDSIQNSSNAISESMTQLPTSLETTFSGFQGGLMGIFSSLGKTLSGLFSSVGSLFGGGGAGGAGGGILGSLFKIGGAAAGAPAIGFSQGGIVPSTRTSRIGADSVPAMLMPGELVVPKSQVNNLRKGAGNNGNSIVNLSITGDISRQTRKEVLGMLPTIASGVNANNRENNIR